MLSLQILSPPTGKEPRGEQDFPPTKGKGRGGVRKEGEVNLGPEGVAPRPPVPRRRFPRLPAVTGTGLLSNKVEAPGSLLQSTSLLPGLRSWLDSSPWELDFPSKPCQPLLCPHTTGDRPECTLALPLCLTSLASPLALEEDPPGPSWADRSGWCVF